VNGGAEHKNSGGIGDLKLHRIRIAGLRQEFDCASHGLSIDRYGIGKGDAVLIFNKAILMSNMEIVQRHQRKVSLEESRAPTPRKKTG
jgi:hypothetical protein